MNIEVEYYEYECSGYCTPNGCKGHSTDIPVAIIIDGESFIVDGYDGGDYPSRGDLTRIKKIQQIIKKLLKLQS